MCLATQTLRFYVHNIKKIGCDMESSVMTFGGLALQILMLIKWCSVPFVCHILNIRSAKKFDTTSYMFHPSKLELLPLRVIYPSH